jgi:hypothetical protein
MPTLQRRSDGGFFIRHFYQDHNTWQILGDGIRYLERRGVREGGWFSTDMFMELWRLGLIDHGNAPPNRPVATPPETVVAAALRRQVRDFHRRLHSGLADSAWEFVLQGPPSTPTLKQFRREVSDDKRPRLASWKIEDIVSVCDLQSDLYGAERFAVVAVKIGLVDSDPREIKQWWLEMNGHWRIWWSGFDR